MTATDRKFSIPRIPRWLLWAGIMALLCSSCSMNKTRRRFSKSVCGSESQLESFEKSVYAITSARCVSCHGKNQVPLIASSSTTTALSAALTVSDLTNPSLSKLVSRTKNGHCGSNCQTDGSEMTDAIAQWRDEQEATQQACKKKNNGDDGSDDDDDDSNTSDDDSSGDPVVTATNPRTIRLQPISLTGIVTSQGLNANNWTELSVSLPAGISGQFVLEVQRYTQRNGVDMGSYRFRRPRVVASGSPVLAINIGLSINDADRSVDQTYSSIEIAVDSVSNANFAPLLSPLVTNPIPQDENFGDSLVVSFEELRSTNTINCQNLGSFQANVLPTIQGSCAGCHSTANANIRRGLVWQGSAQQICNRAVQRINVNSPIASALIQNPQYGSNGHTQVNIPMAAFIAWIESERN